MIETPYKCISCGLSLIASGTTKHGGLRFVCPAACYPPEFVNREENVRASVDTGAPETRKAKMYAGWY
jgi:hypothetical protein